MHHSAYINAEKFYHKYCENNIENKKVLDVGSYDVNGTMKPIFEKGQYVGLDMEEGPNVDIVGVSHDIPFEKDEFDIVISSSCFEHDDMFWVSFQEMCRVLKPGGYMYIQAPSNGPYHGCPGDNWRFYIDSWKALEKWGKKLGYDIELVEHYIDDATPHHESEGLRIWNDSVGIYRKKPIEIKKVSLISTYCDTQEKLDVLSKNMNNVLILKKYLELSKTPSDINEHLETLKKYTEECDTVIEMGVRSIVSTWAFLAGNPKKIISLDLYNPSSFGGNLQEVYDAASLAEIDFTFVEHDSLTYDIDSCDLLFLDTWHDFLQLKKELTRHHSKVNKYIIFHDTVSFSFQNEYSAEEMGVFNKNETNLPKGLWPAIEEFLYHNKNWIIWEKKPNNNGLTVLKKIIR